MNKIEVLKRKYLNKTKEVVKHSNLDFMLTYLDNCSKKSKGEEVPKLKYEGEELMAYKKFSKSISNSKCRKESSNAKGLSRFHAALSRFKGYYKEDIRNILSKEEVDLIRELYLEVAKLQEEKGTKLEIDHIIPYNSPYQKDFILHAIDNLQILTRKQNIKKGDKINLNNKTQLRALNSLKQLRNKNVNN